MTALREMLGNGFGVRTRRVTVVAVVLLLTAAGAVAELQTVQVGGELRIRGQSFLNSFDRPTGVAFTGNNIRWLPSALQGRPIGDPFGRQTILSFFDWDDAGDDYQLVEQRTRLNVRADFTDDVTAFLELEAYQVWGENFRSNYVTGVDQRGLGDVEVYQAYVEARELFGSPVQVRIGRQELVLGSGWLVGAGDHLPEFPGLSFDGVRMTYAAEVFSVDAIWAKLAERSPLEQDGDTDLYAVYGSYGGIEGLTLDAYWLLVRDAASRRDTVSLGVLDWVEDLLGLDDYDPAYLHTIGARLAGERAGFDYSIEGAYQFGNASSVGFLFRPFSYGDSSGDFDAWAADFEAGYTFDHRLRPRLWMGAAYFDGEDNRDISFWEWVNPFATFTRPESSIPFNRLFSDKSYSLILDDQGALSNFWTARGGISLQPTETLRIGADAAWFCAVDTFDQPWHIRVNGRRIPLFPAFSFITEESDDDLGWEAGLWAEYQYSADLLFKAGWRHFFTGDGSVEGNFVDLNGLALNGGTGSKDADYFYLEAALQF